MAVQKFRKKPIVVNAIQWTGENKKEVDRFVGYELELLNGGAFYIHTLEGEMCTEVGDWIIKGIIGEFYPCKPDIFEKTYEPVTP